MRPCGKGGLCQAVEVCAVGVEGSGGVDDDVMALQARIYPEGGPRQKPRIAIEDDTSLTFFMHSEDSTEPNCEGIFLGFKDGQVISKTYSPD